MSKFQQKQTKVNQFSDEFIEVAMHLGYHQKDLYPVDYDEITRDCELMLKGMNSKERQFYLNRKIMIYQARRMKILKQVELHYAIFKKTLQQQNRHNQNVKKNFLEQQKPNKPNRRYKQTQRNSQQRKKQQSRKNLTYSTNGITIDIVRNSSRSSHSRQSSLSSRSNKTASSINSNSLTNSRLQQFRSKQKEKLVYKKRMLQQKIKQNQLKFLKAQQYVLNKSRKTKIRSQISQRIVKQNKQQLDMIKKLSQQQKIQTSQFRILKNNTARQHRLKELSLSKNNDRDIYFVNSVHQDILRSKYMNDKEKYEGKMKNSMYWQQYYNSIQHKSLELAHQHHQSKYQQAQLRRNSILNQKLSYNKQSLSFQQNKQIDAQRRRHQQIQNKKYIQANQLIPINRGTSYERRNKQSYAKTIKPFTSSNIRQSNFNNILT